MELGVGEWLKNEVRDLLDASSVGLYEFIWLLRGREPGIEFDSARSVAEGVLREVLAAQEASLVLLIWPSHDASGAIDLDSLRVTDWEDPRQGEPYAALARL